MRFYETVQDQIIDFGGGPEASLPRLEGWAAACDLYNVPREDRPHLVDMARLLMSGMHDRVTVHGLARMVPDELSPPSIESVEDMIHG